MERSAKLPAERTSVAPVAKRVDQTAQDFSRVDQQAGAARPRGVTDAMDQSSRATTQRLLIAGLGSSPRMVAQRKQSQRNFGAIADPGNASDRPVQREVTMDKMGWWVTTNGTKFKTKKQADKAELEEIAVANGRLTVSSYRAKIETAGNYSLGAATADEADKIGANWVGKALTGGITVSKDRLRQYRSPVFKPNQGVEQANIESREGTSGSWTANGHITIVE